MLVSENSAQSLSNQVPSISYPIFCHCGRDQVLSLLACHFDRRQNREHSLRDRRIGQSSGQVFTRGAPKNCWKKFFDHRAPACHRGTYACNFSRQYCRMAGHRVVRARSRRPSSRASDLRLSHPRQYPAPIRPQFLATGRDKFRRKCCDCPKEWGQRGDFVQE